MEGLDVLFDFLPIIVSHRDSQDPLNPVCPVKNTFLFLNNFV